MKFVGIACIAVGAFLLLPALTYASFFIQVLCALSFAIGISLLKPPQQKLPPPHSTHSVSTQQASTSSPEPEEEPPSPSAPNVDIEPQSPLIASAVPSSPVVPVSTETPKRRLLVNCDLCPLFVFPDDDSILFRKYTKEDNICFYGSSFESVIDDCGSQITFRQEKENQYDSQAVALYIDERKIGYVYKGHMQDMLNDWFRRKEYIYGYISQIMPEVRKARLHVGFYRSIELLSSKDFPLIHTSKKDWMGQKRSENSSLVQLHDSLTIELDTYSDAYIVYNDYGYEIGELGSSFLKWIEDDYDDTYYGFISSVDETDFDNPKFKITVVK